jgi:ribonucleotide reductase beta subunit family protein with ferritin-like domain
VTIPFKTVTEYVDSYPEFSKIADEQMKIFWPWNEIKVGKDKQDLLVNMSESEYHGTITTLKLFTKYETFVGNEHWSGRIAKAYPSVGVQRMAACFAHVELNSHAPFYNEINKELGIATLEFHSSYLDDSVLSDRIKFIETLIDNPDDELSTAIFSMVEGSVLYTNFAYLKHYQNGGKNRIQNVVRGLNMSARDENLHAVGGALIVKTALAEQKRTTQELEQFKQAVNEAAHQIYLHECLIVDKLFEKGKQDGITDVQLKHFAQSRINVCLNNLGLPSLFEVKYNPIADWFYKGINNYQMNDFFQGVGREYSRDWDKKSFTWGAKV